jgi:hypothetical protein
MIPKIAHFHWDGPPINWLRMRGIDSFLKMNPRWDVRIHRTPEHIRKLKLTHLANEADWTWYEALYYTGGFAMATDTVFVKPVPDEWCDADFCGTATMASGQSRWVLYHGCMGAAQGFSLMHDCMVECEKMNHGALAYQQMGIDLLDRVVSNNGGLSSMMRKGLKFRNVRAAAMTPIHWYEVEKCWSEDPIEMNEQTIGVTWFGGNEESKRREWDVPVLHSDSAIVKLAMEVCGDVPVGV